MGFIAFHRRELHLPKMCFLTLGSRLQQSHALFSAFAMSVCVCDTKRCLLRFASLLGSFMQQEAKTACALEEIVRWLKTSSDVVMAR